MRRLAATLLTVVTLVLIGLAFYGEMHRTSPGELHAVHAQIPELASADGCDHCHAGFLQSMRDACTDGCHTQLARQLADGTGLHGALLGERAERCAECHVEHHQGDVPLSGLLAFQRAGFESRDAFDHSHTTFTLTGRHAELDCSACHENADRGVLAEGSGRFTGLDQRCTSCHRDEHEGAFGTDCQGCHGQRDPFDQPPGFAHPEEFPLSNSHGGLSCRRCHEGGSGHGVAELLANPATADVRPCGACHENPHEAPAAGDGDRERRRALFLEGTGDCSRCHDSTRFADLEYGVEEHARAGLPLRGAHGDIECARCHAPDGPASLVAASPNRHAPGVLDHCARCHGNPHEASPERGAAEGEATPASAHPASPARSAVTFADAGDCRRCHGEDVFQPAAVQAGDHGRFGESLVGPHAEQECSGCHGAAPIAVRTLDDCVACHDSPHREPLLAAARAGRTAESQLDASCAVCHAGADGRFRAATSRTTASAHAATSFALEPPHGELDCASCHDPEASFAERYPGRRAEDCASCHGDPHRGEFASGAFAGAACTSCHGELAFSPATFDGEDHGRTRFPLTGAHAAVSCGGCHGEAPTPGEPREFRGLGTACEGCHEDVHRGRFGRGGSSCARCHDTKSFEGAAVDFDHLRWTAFPLEGRHADVPCSACHDEDRSGRTARVSSACDSCHPDIHAGQFRRTGRTDCTRCHSVERPFHEIHFDHQRDSEFPIDETHSRLPCERCHRAYPLPGGGAVVRYRPLGTRCADCHGGREERR